MTRLVVWGAGGHGKVVLETATATSLYEAIVLVDDDIHKHHTHLFGRPVVGGITGLVPQPGDEVFVAIGDNQIRAAAYEFCKSTGLRVATLVHPRAAVSPFADVAEGTLVMPLAVINAGARIGRNCIINSGAIVEHDSVVGDHVHVSPRATLGGGVRIDAFAHLGMGVIVLGGICIGAHTTVGAGAVVIRDLPAHVVAVGVPARINGNPPADRVAAPRESIREGH